MATTTESELVASKASLGGSASMLNQPIVIDVGSHSIKAGFAGGTKPKVSCQSDNVHHCVMLVL